MKTTIIILFAFLISISSFAQQGINYKAVIKDDLGNVVANDLIVVQFTILDGATMVYQESHSPTTDDNGIIIVNIGEGTPLFSTFSAIDWSSGNHSLKTEINTGSGLVDMGTTQFMAVPYALSAANVKGLEAIDEGNGIGWRIVGRDPDSYGDIGENAIDLSYFSLSSTTKGATGNYSTAFGVGTTASGWQSIAMGGSTNALGTLSTAMGRETYAFGYASTTMGYGTMASSAYVSAFGRYNIGSGSLAAWEETDPLFEVGNGADGFNRSNAFTILKNGTITAPSFDLSEITDDKALITKEYLEANGASGLEALDEDNGIGWRLVDRNSDNYGDIGEYAVDLSISNVASATKGATGRYATAMGSSSTASGDYSSSMGNNTEASGDFSTAMGFITNAFGDFSTAMGRSITATYNVTSIGRYNIGGGSNTSWVTTDPLFEVGNGADNANRSNALTILKNGRVSVNGIGDSDFHIFHTNSGASGGLKLENEGDQSWWRMYVSSGSDDLRLYSKINGNNSAIGNFNDVSGAYTALSDRRLKNSIKSIPSVLDKVKGLDVVSYRFNHQKDNTEYVGFIAQDVEKVFPHLVVKPEPSTNESNNYTMDYSGFGVLAIKAIQELQDVIENQQLEIDSLKSIIETQNNNFENLIKRIEQLENK